MNESNPYSDIPQFAYDCMSMGGLIPSMIYEFGEPKLTYLFTAFYKLKKSMEALNYLCSWATKSSIAKEMK